MPLIADGAGDDQRRLDLPMNDPTSEGEKLSAPTIVRPVARRQEISARRSATRKRLVEAAIKVVGKQGFDGASVDEIAERAGFSVGALYSNFASKDELFFAVFDAHLSWFDRKLSQLADADDLAQGVAEWFRALGQEREQFLVFIEFWAYAVRSRKLRPQLAERMAQMRQRMAETLEARAAEAGQDLVLPSDELALLLGALMRGLILEKLAEPGVVPDSEIGQLMASLVP